MGWGPQALKSRLEAGRMASHEAGRRAAVVGPARARDALRARVEAHAGDLEEDVPVVRVDRDPLAGPGLAEGHQQAGGLRAAQQPRGGEHERDRAGAVVALVEPLAVAAAPDV